MDRESPSLLIFTALSSAVVGAVIAWLLGFVDLRDYPPEAQLAPTGLVHVLAGEVVEFDASASSDRAGSPLDFRWSVGGTSPNETHIAACDSNAPSALRCTFFRPGTFGVSVSVENDTGLTDAASASVQISSSRGYAALIVRRENPAESITLQRVFLLGIDWAQVIAAAPDEIISLWDPDQKRFVYAANVRPNVDRARELLEALEQPHTATLTLHRWMKNAGDVMKAQLAEIGLRVELEDVPIITTRVMSVEESTLSGFAHVGSLDEVEHFFQQ